MRRCLVTEWSRAAAKCSVILDNAAETILFTVEWEPAVSEFVQGWSNSRFRHFPTITSNNEH